MRIAWTAANVPKGEEDPLLNNSDICSEESNVSQEEERKFRIITIGPVMVMVTFVFSCSMSVTIQYINDRFTRRYESMSRHENHNNTENPTSELDGKETELQDAASLFILIWAVILTVPGVVSTLFLGSYSDTAGRKTVLTPCLLSMTFRLLVTTCVVDLDWPISILFVGAVAEGITGGIGTMYMSSFAYLSDLYPQKGNRAFQFMFLDAFIGITAGIANLCRLCMIREMNYYYPHLVLIILLLVCARINGEKC